MDKSFWLMETMLAVEIEEKPNARNPTQPYINITKVDMTTGKTGETTMDSDDEVFDDVPQCPANEQYDWRKDKTLSVNKD